MHKGGCTLSWKPPEDDGGEPIEEYILEAQDMNERGKFVEVGRCKAGDTSFKVKNLKDRTDYKFRVKARNKEGESEPLQTETATTIKDPWGIHHKPCIILSPYLLSKQ